MCGVWLAGMLLALISNAQASARVPSVIGATSDDVAKMLGGADAKEAVNPANPNRAVWFWEDAGRATSCSSMALPWRMGLATSRSRTCCPG